MAGNDTQFIRTVGLLAEGGAGKTTLGEALLYAAGETTRQGRVDEESSALDFEPEEIRRKTTLSTAFHTLEWKRHQICLVDPPGYANFLPDTRYAMEAMSGAIFIAGPAGQLKVETERLWNWAGEMRLPRVVCLSRMDREEGDFGAAVDALGKALGSTLTPIQIPIGAQNNFSGVIDLLSMKAWTFEGDKGAISPEEIPEDMQADADVYRERLIEAIAETDDDLLTRYLEGEELSAEAVERVLGSAVASTKIFPVQFISASQALGVQPVLDAIVRLLPPPGSRPDVVGMNPKTQEEVTRRPDVTEPFSARVFKTVDSQAGKLSLFIVSSGKITSDSVVYNTTRDTKERLGQLFQLKGKKQEPVGTALPGEIIGVAKLKETHTGDTLSDEKQMIRFPPLQEFSPAISFALGLKSRNDEEKIMSSLDRLNEEDPALRVDRDQQSNEILISGAGQLHIEVVVEKLKRKYGVEVELKAPKVPYRETINGKTEAHGRLKKQSGGRGQFGDTWLRVAPLPRGKGFEFINEIRGGAIPRQYIPSVEKGVVDALGKGFLAGYPMVDVQVALYDGSYHDVDSSDMAFQIAGSIGIQNALEKAKPVLLEPIMNLDITVPEEFMGDITGDVNRRRGRLISVDAKGSNQIIKASVPMAEILTYAPDLRSMTSGRGTFESGFSHYEEVPNQLTGKIIQESKIARGETAD